MRKFITFLAEERKPRVETTGHLTRAADLLLYGDHNNAVRHLEGFHNFMTTGERDPEQDLAHKVDGGMSIILGRDEDGRHFVAYKSGKKKYYTEDDIDAEGKKHLSDVLKPALLATMKMKNLQPATAFQSDVLFSKHPGKSSFVSNAMGTDPVRYVTPTNLGFAFAPHSQYKLADGDMIRVPGIDHTQYQSDHSYAPKLSLHDFKYNEMNPETSEEIQGNFNLTRALGDDEGYQEFASQLGSMASSGHDLHKMMMMHTNDAARKTGERTTDNLMDFVRDRVTRSANALKTQKGKDRKMAELESHLSFIEENRPHFDAMYKAHSELTNAQHRLLRHHNDHNDQFPLQVHGEDPEQEGVVSTIDGQQVKFVSEGEGISKTGRGGMARRLQVKQG